MPSSKPSAWQLRGGAIDFKDNLHEFSVGNFKGAYIRNITAI